MTLLLMTLERFPLKIVQGHLSFSTGGEVECASCLHNLLCQLSACKTRAALSYVMSGMWEPNNRLGTGSPCKAISKTCFGKKKRSLTCLFPANICSEIEETCFMEYTQVYTHTHTHIYIYILHGDMALPENHLRTKTQKRAKTCNVHSVVKSRNTAITVQAEEMALYTDQPLQTPALSSNYMVNTNS